jgi:phage gpG-like protein
MADTKFHFQRVMLNIEQVKTELPVILGNQAQNYFTDSWRQQGWNGEPWKEVQRRDSSTKVYKYSKPAARTRAILVKSGRLRRAVANSIRETRFDRVRLVVDVPYAEYHNDGTDKLPQRRFMGQSAELERKQILKITSFIDKVWQA